MPVLLPYSQMDESRRTVLPPNASPIPYPTDSSLLAVTQAIDETRDIGNTSHEPSTIAIYPTSTWIGLGKNVIYQYIFPYRR